MSLRPLDLTGYGLPYWLDIERPVYPSCIGELKTDVAIVGAGISGLKVADYLSEHGLSCVVLEANQVGEGASSRNQGCIVTGLSSPYGELVEQFSRETARSLLGLSRHNHELLVEQIDRLGIDCDYQILGETGLVLSGLSSDGALGALRRDAQLLTEDGVRAEYLDADAARTATGSAIFRGGLRLPDDAQFHSGKFVVGLGVAVARSPNILLFERSPVVAVDTHQGRHVVRTPHGSVEAEHLFIATNALVPQLLPALQHNLRAERGQVLVTEPMEARPCSGCYSAGVAWWREIMESDGRYRLLFGGGRFRDEPDSLFKQYGANGRRNPRLATAGFRPTAVHQRRLQTHLAAIFPHLTDVEITHRWGGLQSFTFDGLPVIGVLDAARRIHGMAGFSGLGNSFTNVGASYLAARIAGRTGEVERRFGSTIQLLLAPSRESATWPGDEPTHAHSGSGGMVRVERRSSAS